MPSGIPLADVAARQDATITLPDNYPTVTPVPVQLSELRGTEGVAAGALTLLAPADGTAGIVCFPDGIAPVIDSDAAQREDGWTWSSDLESDCIDLSPGATALVHLSASNATAANSVVAAHLAVEYRSASGEPLSGTVPIAFTSTRPVNAAAFSILAFVLLAVGLLVPLALLWLFGWWFTRITRGRELLRASVPVRIAQDGRITTDDGTALESARWGLDQFRFEPQRPDGRKFADPDLGNFRARVGLNPFGRPWYQLEARDGHVVFGPSAYLPPRQRSLGVQGRILGVHGDLGRVWALVVRETSLAASRDEPISARLVVFVRNPTGESAVYQDRMREIAGYGGLVKQLAAARDALAEVSARTARQRSTESRVSAARGSRPTVTENHTPSARTDGEPPRRNEPRNTQNEPPQRGASSRPSDSHRPSGSKTVEPPVAHPVLPPTRVRLLAVQVQAAMNLRVANRARATTTLHDGRAERQCTRPFETE
ncbi:hypothetical protein [Homoserinibacter gongjuensis]|uniref:Uncharacterized protein n=1 Tax=Homoserinibacter gongjuensis TaxID=1162968 RepID=A0ABQ6K2E1_9MICO|nr:hypothetical protein [Homoserinibacter gongjuensis]GMA93077.1 hypothetical protein GCM10025869_36060 [Homoserinibacter gongjuensis]